MNDTELINRILALSPSEVSKLNFHLNKPLDRTKKPTSSKVEEAHITVLHQECSNCDKMTVSQSSEDYHILENSCTYLKSREFDKDKRRMTCVQWHARRKTIPVTEGVEEDDPTE
jgi:hypothetical protein